jgi:futalosine hydrolase
VTSEKKNTVGLISSVLLEGDLLIKELGLAWKRKQQGLLWYEGRKSGQEIVFCISGIGKTNAAHAATLLVKDHSPSLVVNFGIGGAYPSSRLHIGDIAVATREVYADEGVWLKDGFHSLELMGIPLARNRGKTLFNEFPLDKRLAWKALKSAELIADVASGTFATVSTCTGTKKRGVEISKRLNAICENMEGAAVAHICSLYGPRFVEIRGVSNMVEDRDTSKWNIGLAAGNCQRAVIEFLKRERIN